MLNYGGLRIRGSGGPRGPIPTTHCDRGHAQDRQLGFQDPASPIMEGIVDLHHDITSPSSIVCIFVLHLSTRTAITFRVPPSHAYDKVTHGKVIETVRTITPSSILALVAIPSFALLYAADEVTSPAVTIKAVGHQ